MSDMVTEKEKELVQIMFEIALVLNSEEWHRKSIEETAAWVRKQLRGCGFNVTDPVGATWGILEDGEGFLSDWYKK